MTVEIEFKNGRTIELANVISITKNKDTKKTVVDYYNEPIDEDMELITTLKIDTAVIEEIVIAVV